MYAARYKAAIKRMAVALAILLLSFSFVWAECWNDGECDWDELCECPYTDVGSCDSAGTCVPRDSVDNLVEDDTETEDVEDKTENSSESDQKK